MFILFKFAGSDSSPVESPLPFRRYIIGDKKDQESPNTILKNKKKAITEQMLQR